MVADALSRKSHCHCLEAESYNDTLCNEMRKLNLEMVSQGSLNHIAMESTLQDSVISVQLNDEGNKIINQKLAQGEEKYRCFHLDPRGVLWFDNCIVVPKTINSEGKFLMKHTFQSFLFIPAAQRCTRILDRSTGGPE